MTRIDDGGEFALYSMGMSCALDLGCKMVSRVLDRYRPVAGKVADTSLRLVGQLERCVSKKQAVSENTRQKISATTRGHDFTKNFDG